MGLVFLQTINNKEPPNFFQGNQKFIKAIFQNSKL